MSEGKMLSFYKTQNVAPVFQIIPDIQGHFDRRTTLYRQLGLKSSNFSGKRILEIGPGTGQNALFLASKTPASLTLVEPNPVGLLKIEQAFAPYPKFRELVEVAGISIETIKGLGEFDLVICEGLAGASGHQNPTRLIRAISKHVSPNGELVLTCIDYPGYLSEMLRRLLGYELSKKTKNFDDRVTLLTEVFSPHLDSLAGVTRSASDWVIDNLISPASIDPLVTFNDLVKTLSKLNFSVKGTSPRFITDWTWYKQAALKKDFFNRSALDCYWESAHVFMDCRTTHPPQSASRNRRLAKQCQHIHASIRKYEETGSSTERNAILTQLSQLISMVETTMPLVAESLREVCEWMSQPKLSAASIKSSRKFGTWFGRAQTYVSFDIG